MQKGIDVNKEYGGFLARLEALGNLTENNINLKIANWFIILLFILS